tara:strand:+ start:4059 stop:4577 length:519 start_codon:yes stop_codon:yes gene_type:complete
MRTNIKSNNLFYKIPLSKISKYVYKINYIYIILFLLIIYFIYKYYFNNINNDDDDDNDNIESMSMMFIDNESSNTDIYNAAKSSSKSKTKKTNKDSFDNSKSSNNNIFKKIFYFFAGIFKKMHNLHCKILRTLYTGKAKFGPLKNIRDKVNGFNTKNVNNFCKFFDKKLKKY